MMPRKPADIYVTKEELSPSLYLSSTSRMSRTEIESQISRPELEKTEGLTTLTKPIVSTGSFDKEKYTDLTPVIGRVYDNVQLKELLSAPDDVIRDFALLGKIA